MKVVRRNVAWSLIERLFCSRHKTSMQQHSTELFLSDVAHTHSHLTGHRIYLNFISAMPGPSSETDHNRIFTMLFHCVTSWHSPGVSYQRRLSNPTITDYPGLAAAFVRCPGQKSSRNKRVLWDESVGPGPPFIPAQLTELLGLTWSCRGEMARLDTPK
jgi:hypothetical protein